MGYSFLINENILKTYNDIYTAEVPHSFFPFAF